MAALQSQYNKRLQKEFMTLEKTKPQGISVSLPTDNFHVWEALIPGPEDSLYKGGKFKVQITIPENYPLSPPVIHFLTPIYHMNVSQQCGQVCLGFLSEAEWQPTATMEQIVHALFSLLSKPDETNAFDHELLNQYHHYPGNYRSEARTSAINAK